MPQVVDSGNMVEFLQKGSVPEFKAPTEEAPKPDAKPDAKPDTPTEIKVEEAKATETGKVDDKPRDETGKFVKAEEGTDPNKTDDAEDAELPERVRRQIGKKHRQMKEAEEFARESDARAEAERRRADAAERELQRIRGGKSDGPKPGEGDSVDPDEPKQGDFKTVGEYTRALVKYEAEKAGKTGRAQAEQSKQQEAANAVIDAFVERQEAFKAATPDYKDVIEASDVYVPPLVQQYLVESDVGPQLAYHFAKNPDEVTRLKKLSPTRQVAELGKLEMKFEKKTDTNVVPITSKAEVSKAPAPISPLEGKSAPIVKDPSQMTVSELRAFREQERRAKGR